MILNLPCPRGFSLLFINDDGVSASQGALMLRSLIVAATIVARAYSANAEPGTHWKIADFHKTPWSVAIAHDVQAFAVQHQPTAVLVVQDDVIAASLG
jgi:hypothetical protein